MRMLILKLTLLLAAEIVCASGCDMPAVTQSTRDRPLNPVAQTAAQTTSTDASKPVVTQPSKGCDCGCNLGTDCQCPRCRNPLVSPTAGKAATAGPQFVLQPQTRLVYQCRNGVCGWYAVTENVRVQVTQPAVIDNRTKVYIQANYLATRNASIVMRRAIGECDGISWFEGDPPEINGQRWWPTAVKQDGTTWTPGAKGWTDDSLAEFKLWVGTGRQIRSLSSEAAPTPYSEVVRVLALLPTPQVGFVDFGCGDARWCIAAAERWPAVRITGVEIDSARASAARERVAAVGMSSRITIITGDATTTDVVADVGVAYLYADVLERLKPRLEGLRAFASYLHRPPGMDVVANGDSWIHIKQLPVLTQARAAVWNGYTYSHPVCNSPGCAMCNSIRGQLNSAR